jgi:hemerythrin-like domain-containing protein
MPGALCAFGPRGPQPTLAFSMKTNQSQCGCSCAGQHPIDVLMQEHATILSVLDAGEREIARVAAGDPLRQAFWRDYVQFLDHYADRCHHKKEEDVLFAELEQAGMPREHGPTHCMRNEHATMRALRQRLPALLAALDQNGLCQAVGAGIAMLREHIGKENEVLFPMARTLLGEEAFARVRRGFSRIEHTDMGTGAHERFELLAKALCGDVPEPVRTQRSH